MRGKWRLQDSFAYFVPHAEVPNPLRELAQRGQTGALHDHRVPATLVILLVIGAVAVTSGNSLCMGAVSLIGILGAIGMLTSSTGLIRETLDE